MPKISQLTSAVDLTANDLIQIVDVEDGVMAPSGTNKKATAQLLANELGKLTNVTATGSTTARSLANRFADVVNVRDFGVVGNGITDDTAAFQAALNRADAIGAGVVYIPAGLNILIDSGDLVLKQGVSIFGDSFNAGTYEQGKQTKIILNPTYTIRVSSIGCSIKGLFIRRKGLYRATNPTQAADVVASMSGTAITVYSTSAKGNLTASYARSGTTVTVTSLGHGLTTGNVVRVFYDTTDTGLIGDKTITVVNTNTFTFTTASTGTSSGTIHWEMGALTDDVYIGHCFIAGFNQAIYASYCGRYMIEHIYGDNRNGIWTRECYDAGRIENCHFWPWYTSGSGASVARETGFWIDDANDKTSVVNSFCLGYNVGFKVSGSYVALINCQVDGNLSYLAADSKGFWITDGTTRNNTIAVELTACGSCSHQYNYYFDSSNGTTFHSMVNCTGWAEVTNHLNIVKGTVYATGCNFYNTTTNAAVAVGANAAAARIAACSFADVGTVYNINSASTFKVSITPDNSYIGICNGLNDDTAKLVATYSNRQSLYSIGGGGGPMHFYMKAGGSTGSPTVVGSPITLGGFTVGGHDGSQFIKSGVFRATSIGTISTGIIPTQFLWTTENDAGIISDRLVLDQNGNLKPITDNAYTLGASGLRWSSVWSANGTIQTSDERTKTDINESPLGLDFIGSLNPVSYKFKVGGNKVIRQVYRDSEGNEVDTNADDANPAEIITEEIEGQRTHFGLIAQEVKAALPEGVDFGGWILTDKDDPDSEQGLRYEQFVAPLIKAVQELKARVEELESAP